LKSGAQKSFGITPSGDNEWTFKMPEGNATIQITLTNEYPDPANAELEWFSVSDGNVIQDGEYTYLVTVPPNSNEEFAIYAQAKNPYIAPVLTQTNGGGDVGFGATLGLDEGLNEYTITVTSADKNYTNTYTIKVIKLPNLSLATFQVKKDAFVRDLAQLAKQNVYVPYSSVTVFAEANDNTTTVSITPDNGAVSSLGVKTPTAVTVTVSKDSLEVDPIYKTASYTLDLYYGNGMDFESEAKGGYVSFIPGEGNVYYEVHTFDNAGTYTLSFNNEPKAIYADYLIVGGGGGAGGPDSNDSNDRGGGGGAGGLLYAGGTLTLAGGSLTVMVGAGGAGGGNKEKGNDGDYSSLGDITVPGGGYGGSGRNNPLLGGNGGSGGGNGSSANNEILNISSGQANTATAVASGLGGTDVYSGVKGNSGGKAGPHPGGGGGGAGGAGEEGSGDTPAKAG
jgi:hypothetical protein